jgi:hypothetical protein
MPLKASFIVPTRNKREWVERAARSYIGQTYTPMEIVFFDQSSTDGTLEILKRLEAEYDGPNKVRVLSCPSQGIGGTAAGMNADIEWVHRQIDGDVVLWGNADDFAYPARTARTMRAFQEFNPSWVSCIQHFMTPSLELKGESELADKRDRWIELDDAVAYQVGSTGALAYARDLWEKHGPMRGIEQNDIVLPIMSFLERGMYFIAEPLHVYVFHASESNQGTGGQILAAKSETERLQLDEVAAFNLTSNWMSVLTRLRESGQEVMPEGLANIREALWENVQQWERCRRELTLRRVAPVGLHLKRAPASP